MTIALRRRDARRLERGQPIYLHPTWAPRVTVRHQRWNPALGPVPRHAVQWWWQIDNWGPVWHQIPTHPARQYTLEDIELLLRRELAKYPGLDLSRKRKRR
jgi:hypothetical protein